VYHRDVFKHEYDHMREHGASRGSKMFPRVYQNVPCVDVQGNCSKAPSGGGGLIDPARTSEKQCVISVSSAFVISSGRIWIHDVYIVAKRPGLSTDSGANSANPTTLLEISGGDAWITSAVLVGDRGSSSRGVDVSDKGRLYAWSAPPSHYLLLVSTHLQLQRA
jgi:hypothetical protein